jgi:hypothetical protein
VRRGRQLTLELCSSQPEGFERAKALRVSHGLSVPLRAFVFEVFHPFLNPRFRVDQAFSSVTHQLLRSLVRVNPHYKITE